MIAVIFEVEPTPQGLPAYLELAAALRPQLEAMDGFISVERFQSLSQRGRGLRLRCGRAPGPGPRGRRRGPPRRPRLAGRTRLFADYRLRVAEVQRDYGPHARDQAPEDARRALDGLENGRP